MRDILADSMHCLQKFCKPGKEQNTLMISFRAVGAIWQAHALQDSVKPIAKGCQIRIKEDGVGEELQQTLAKVALGSNILNHLVRTGGPLTKQYTRKMTLGRLLIVGGKALSLQKSVTAQKAAFEATKKHLANAEAKIEKTSLKDSETRQQHLKAKLGSYGDYAQSHANLDMKDYEGIRSPSRDPDNTDQKTKPNVPAIVTIPHTTKKPAPENQNKEVGKEPEWEAEGETPRKKGKGRSNSKGSG